MTPKLLRLVIAALLLLAPAMAAAMAPASVDGFDVDAATRAWLDTLDPEARARSDAYFEGGYWLLLWGTLVAIAAEWVLLHFGLSARFRALGERITRRRWLVPAIYAVPYTIVSSLIVLPWTIYTDFIREGQYGLMNLGFGAWLGEQAIGLGVAIIGLALFLMALFAVIRRAPRTWWLWGTGVVAAFIALTLLIAPVFIAPLFNDYTPMAEGPLRDRILAMTEAHDVPADDVYVFDQSKQHDRISANVSGLFGTMRISLNDNLLERTSPAEVEAVMGHELGHYVLDQIYWIIGLLTLIFGLGLFLIAKLAPRLIARHGERWGVRGVDDPAALPVFSIILTVYMLVMTPALNSMTRVFEAQADAFGLDAARQPDGFAAVSMKLSQYRKIDPGPIEELIFYDHPSGRARVRRAMEWKAANSEPD